MTKVFCQDCFELTKDVSKSVWDVNTFGRCSRCGSDAVLSHEVVAGAQKAAERRVETTSSEDNWSNSPLGGRGRRMIPENESYFGSENVRILLRHHGASELEEWWDGHYFFRCDNFMYYQDAIAPMGRYNSTMELMLENRNGSQRYITFEVTIKKLEVTDSNEFSSATQKNTP
jgi:hypothetical protein